MTQTASEILASLTELGRRLLDAAAAWIRQVADRLAFEVAGHVWMWTNSSAAERAMAAAFQRFAPAAPSTVTGGGDRGALMDPALLHSLISEASYADENLAAAVYRASTMMGGEASANPVTRLFDTLPPRALAAMVAARATGHLSAGFTPAGGYLIEGSYRPYSPPADPAAVVAAHARYVAGPLWDRCTLHDRPGCRTCCTSRR